MPTPQRRRHSATLYKLVRHPEFEHDLQKIGHNSVLTKMVVTFMQLQDDPRPMGYIQLRGFRQVWYRVVVGDYRLVYQVDDTAHTVYLALAVDRKQVYPQLKRRIKNAMLQYRGHRYRVAQVERRAAKIVMYHGTSSAHLPSILKHGLRADPGHRRFTLDSKNFDPEHATYGGAYLTPWIREAQKFASDAVDDQTGADPLLCVVQVETRAEMIVPDEDHFISLTDPFVLEIQWALGPDATMLDLLVAVRDGTVDLADWVAPWIAALKSDEGTRNIVVDPEVLLRHKTEMVGLLVLMVQYRVAQWPTQDPARQKIRADLGVPDKATARQQFVEALDRFSRKIQRLTDPQGAKSKSVRSLQDIGFRGANRILGILKYRLDWDTLAGVVVMGEQNPNVLAAVKALYPTKPSIQWQDRTGQVIFQKPAAKAAARLAYPVAAPNWAMEKRRITAAIQRLRGVVEACAPLLRDSPQAENIRDYLGNNATVHAEQIAGVLGYLEKPTRGLLERLDLGGTFHQIQDHLDLYREKMDVVDHVVQDYQKELQRSGADDYSQEDLDHRYNFTQDVKPILMALEMVPGILQDFRRFIQYVDTDARYFDHANKVAPMGGRHDVVPPGVAPVEIMWHATTAYREIMSGGFKTKDELGGKAAGLGGAVEGISFTGSQEIAEGIAAALVDLVRLLRGDLTREALEQYGASLGLDAATVTTAYHNAVGSKANQNPLDAFNFYQAFQHILSQAGYQGLRYDPLFFGIDPAVMAQVDPKNIGVIEAKIDTTQAHRYLRSMEEWRVPKSAILSFGPVGSQVQP